jgi:hypothetical protein
MAILMNIVRVGLCVLMLLMPSRPYEIALMALVLITVSRHEILDSDGNEGIGVELGVSSVINIVICIGFIIYSILIHYRVIDWLR